MVVDGAQIVTFRPGVAWVDGYKVGTVKDYWLPSGDDVRRVEARLRGCVATALPNRLAEVQDYARQYSGFYLDGHKRVFVQLFRHAEAYPNWRCVPVVVDDGGDNYLRLEYDFESDSCENVYVNGGA